MQRVLRGSQVVGDEPLGEAIRDDVRDLPADEVVSRVAELLLRLDVQQDDLARLVDDDHRVGRRLQQAAVLRLGVPADLALARVQHVEPRCDVRTRLEDAIARR